MYNSSDEGLQKFTILIQQLIIDNKIKHIIKTELEKLSKIITEPQKYLPKFIKFIQTFIEGKKTEIVSFDGKTLINEFYNKTPRRKEYRIRCSDCRQDFFVQQWENIEQIPKMDWKFDGTEKEAILLHLISIHKELWE